MKTKIIATSVALLMSTTAFAKDCKYVQKIILDDNNVILSAKTEYICKESKPIIVLPPKTTDEIKRVVPRAVSHTELITYRNIENILIYLKKNKIPTMLIGMKAPSNLGKEYVNEFNAIYPNLSKKYDVFFYPFFLKDVALEPSFNQKDMIHPNKNGVIKIVENIFPYFRRFYKSLMN